MLSTEKGKWGNSLFKMEELVKVCLHEMVVLGQLSPQNSIGKKLPVFQSSAVES